jgi:hypothetical protein
MGKSQPCLQALAILEDELEVNILEVLNLKALYLIKPAAALKTKALVL